MYEYVEPDYLRYRMLVPNDPRFSEQWALSNTGQAGGRAGADAAAVAAWNTRTSTDGVIVAVLDSGIRATHEDLAANLWVNPGEIPGNGIDDDGNGYVDDVHGINSLVGPGAPGNGDPFDDHGHGTSVAGVIGAVGNNGRGVSGVAWDVRIMALKFDDIDRTGDGGTYVSNEIECIEYALAHGAKIINISYGGYFYSRAELEVLERARANGVIIVAAAGNEGVDNGLAASYPASYPLDNIIAVANSDRRDELALSSTYGGLVELAAPGTDILTCSNAGDTDYRIVSGSSLSSPLVAGAMGLLRAQFPQETPRGLINRLLRSVDPISALSGKVSTGGRLNLARALTSTSNRPFNDDFAQRSVLEGDSVRTRGASGGATLEAAEPVHGAGGGTSLWWSWVAPRDGTAVVSTRGSDFDTMIAVYTGTAVGQLTRLADNDDADGATTSRTSFSATRGTTYHLAVDGQHGATGMVALSWSLQPANDHFSAAELITGVSAQTTGDNTNASRETLQPASTGDDGGIGATVWYRWTAPRASSFVVAIRTDSFMPLVTVYRASGAGDNLQLQLLASSEDVVSFDATDGVTYYFAVDSTSPATGFFALSLLEAYWAFPYGRISSSFALSNGMLVLVNDNGYLLSFLPDVGYWALKIKGSLDVSTPAIAPDGTVYVTTSRGLFAITRPAGLKWERIIDAGISGSPALAADGTIYAHADDGWLHAYTPSGTLRWRARVPGSSYASPSIGSDGTIYHGSDDGHLYAISPIDGAIKWRVDTGGEVFATVAIGTDGTVYVGNLNGIFVAITPAGTQRWSFTAGDGISSSAAIGADGTLYFGAYDGKLYALAPSGTQRWAYATGDDIRGSSPAVGADGTIFIGSYDGKLHAVTAAGTLKQEYQTGDVIRSSPLLTGGEVMFGSNDQNVYFLYPQPGAANSPWPMHRQNSARTGRRALATAPVIHTQPAARTVAIGGGATVAVNADGEGPLAFQWYLNGAPIAGATESSYEIRDASASSAGHYTVSVSNARGSLTSAAAEVKVVNASNVGRIINLSTRALAGSGSKTLIVGMAVGGGGGLKDLLIRGAGPTLGLAPYNVPGTISDPKLTLFSGQTSIATNDNWGGEADVVATSKRVGAFDFSSAASKDAALVTKVNPGNYSAHITAADNSTGVALAEFYDATEVFTAGAPRLVNVSARADVGRGADVLIVGFVITGDTPCKLLIRAVGPTLGLPQYGVDGVLLDPKLEVRSGAQVLVASNDNWGAGPNTGELEAVMSQVGAFPLALTSKDAALVVTLEPGLYSAVISGVADTTGVALAEVYQVE